MVRRCWVNFQCRGVLHIWIKVGQGPIVLAVGAGGGCLDIFSLICQFSFLSPSLWETARYRLKYCLEGPLSPKQPTNQPGTTFPAQISLDTDILAYWIGKIVRNCAAGGCRNPDFLSTRPIAPLFLFAALSNCIYAD